jgi:hypothetical protein
MFSAISKANYDLRCTGRHNARCSAVLVFAGIYNGITKCPLRDQMHIFCFANMDTLIGEKLKQCTF